jgi:tetratricopeptide (TPR) repeat protein
VGRAVTNCVRPPGKIAAGSRVGSRVGRPEVIDMPWWPFRRKRDEELSPEQVRDRLIAAASGSRLKLGALCERYKGVVAANLDLMRKAPAGMLTDPASIEQYVQRLGTVAQCLATECGAPELWDELCGTPDDNPLLQWDRWYGELPGRMERLEHDQLIAEARSFIERARELQGDAARQNEVFLLGRLAELLFHSGRVSDAIGPFREALAACREMGDVEGEMTYLKNLLEAHRYLGEVAEAAAAGEEVIAVCHRHGKDPGPVRKLVRQIRDGEPPCRIVCARDDGTERELDELEGAADGRYQFRFRRNRLSLQKATALVRRGNELASGGQLAEALEKYHEASEVDPHDPDPMYQSGMCLLELGAYAQARATYEDIERIAPGWFRCRTDRWLAQSLEEGTVSDEEFRLLRALEDGGLEPAAAMEIARKAVATYPGFAPLYLVLGDLQRDRGDTESAIRSYRAGLERVAEPDLESRLSCALAGLLPEGSPERGGLIERALGLEGSLVALATARVMGLRFSPAR